MGGFFPSFPFYIPHSEGIAHWFDIFWWSFQLIVMGGLLLALRKLAIGADRERNSGSAQQSSPQSGGPA